MFVKGTASVLLIALSIIGIASGGEFCGRDDLCAPPGPVPHISCDASANGLSPHCESGTQEIELTSQQIEQILKSHNEVRNKIASGNEPGFKSGSRMTTMKWNQDLARYAGMNVRRCILHTHDCHNTDQMKYSGQNINTYETSSAGDYANPEEFMKGSIASAWYEKEMKKASQKVIDLPQTSGGFAYLKSISHFMQLVQDNANEVGCALINFPQDGNKFTVFVCDYSLTTVANFPVYAVGPAASKCKTGNNPQFPGLCSINESVSPLDPRKAV